PGFVFLTIGLNATLLIATLVDYLLLPPAESLQVSRILEPTLSLGGHNTVQVDLRNTHIWPWRIEVKDEPPQTMPNDWRDTLLTATPAARLSVAYQVTPTKRGDVQFGDTWIRLFGKLGLIACIRRYPTTEHAKVYPNLLE